MSAGSRLRASGAKQEKVLIPYVVELYQGTVRRDMDKESKDLVGMCAFKRAWMYGEAILWRAL